MKNEYIIRDEAMTIPVLPKEQRLQFRNADEAFEEGWRQALGNLANLPAADVVEVQHGRWIVSATNLHFDSKCSACGETFYSPLRGAYIVHYAKYCPNCGAKMDGGQDEC